MEGPGNSDVDSLGGHAAPLFPDIPRKLHSRKSRLLALATSRCEETGGRTPARQGGDGIPTCPALPHKVQYQIQGLKAKQVWPDLRRQPTQASPEALGAKLQVQ